jgi:hypothetical protein
LLLAAATVLAYAPRAGAQAVSPIDFGGESLGDVRLGVALAAVTELVDAPELLARPSSQGFVDDTFARLTDLASDPLVRGEVSRTREDLRAQTGAAFDRTLADRELAELTRSLLHALPAPRNRLCSVGILAEVAAYNARVLRSPSVDAEIRHALGKADVADTLVSSLSALRERVAAEPAGRWVEIARASGAVVAAILGPAATPPFPENSRVWLVLLRSRPTNADIVRRHTPHLWLDVVRFDGSHRTIGAYPSGGNFAHDAPHLSCAFDREPNDESERAVPLAPPPATTSAQLAASLTARCTARANSAVPYRVRDASDARFIIDEMLAAGVDAAAVMREAAARER